MSATVLPTVRREEARRERLARMKRLATSLLAVASVAFLVLTLWGGDSAAADYGRAVAEASMIGGLADWFAVTALFRHPLGIPVPHTAIIVARKDQFGETLGTFIQEAFLTPDAIVDRLHSAQVVPRLAAWLREPANADRLAGEVLDGAVQLADVLADDDVRRVVREGVRSRLESLPVAPTAGRLLEFAIRDGRHQEALEAVLREVDRFVEENREELRAQLGAASPWWLPGAAEDRLFERLVDGVHTLVEALLADGDHELRRRFEQRLRALAEDLQTSPELRARGEQLKAELLELPEVGRWVDDLWRDAKAQLRDQAARPESELRRRAADLVCSVGRHLDDPALAARVDGVMTTAVTYVVDRFHGEIVDLVSGTISRWDAAETADRLELLLGPDLQFIRINGTVVGALAGLVLHAVGDVLA